MQKVNIFDGKEKERTPFSRSPNFATNNIECKILKLDNKDR